MLNLRMIFMGPMEARTTDVLDQSHNIDEANHGVVG